MRNDNVIFLIWSIKNSLMGKYMLLDGADVRAVYRGSESKVLSVFRMIWFKLHLPEWVWFNHKIKGKEGILVIFDAMISEKYLKWVIKENPKAKVIFLYWNPITLARMDVNKVKQIGCEVWSYGTEQCKTYHIKQNSHVYCDSMYKEAKQKNYKKKYDIIFAGKDKGRWEYLNALAHKPYWRDFKWYFHISPDHFWLIFKKRIYKNILPYDKLMCKQIQSKAVLELVPSALKETTMRAIDAMCLEQKLITDNTNAVNIDFYDSNNIFILGMDKEQNLNEFINSPFKPIPKEVWDRVSLSRWIERFANDEPLNMEIFEK